MSTDNNIKNYTGADIEKYHKGLLSAKERHDLEKAALDDPFLAEALEGYAVEGVDHAAAIIDLKKRLAEKVESGKVIVMKSGGKSSFPWLRVAALVVIIAGAGLMARQFIFTGKTKEIVQAEPKKTGETTLHDSANTITKTPDQVTENTKPGTVDVPAKQNEQTFTLTTKETTPKGTTVSSESVGETTAKTNEVTINKTDRDKQPATAPVKTEEDKKIQDNMASGAGKKDIAPDETKNKPAIINNQDVVKEEAKDKKQQPAEIQNNRAVAASRQIANDQGYRNQATNTFRGRVTDVNNVGLPFARVYNPADNNAGTYTDVAGNFNLTYPDTVLSVQVRSVGFENANIQLRNNVPSNQVILQDDKSLAAQTLPGSRKINAEERSKLANVKLEEPEPADGWDNYDTYLTNNLNVPEEIKTKQDAPGQVRISFEVDKNGEPINIKVEKSLCPKCDEEAKRLIKEGPKWKRNAKKGRTTVTVPFNNSL